jgi:predicted dienelactone hydrolase
MRLLAAAVMALLLLATAARAADPDYAAAGPFGVRVADDTWSDDGRERDLPVRLRLPDTPSRAPVILFSHGLGGSRAGGAEWGAHWASHGFAVIHLQHPGSDESLWRDKPVEERRAGMRNAVSLEQFGARIADVRFVLAELDRRQRAGDPLAARLDLGRLGMSGHSYGAVTTLYLGGQRPALGSFTFGDLSEKRFTAFLAFSPQASPGSDPGLQFAPFDRPALLVTGTLDGQTAGGLGVPPEQRLVPFEAMPGGNKFQLVVDQADHMFFNGTRGLRDFGVAGRTGIDFSAVETRGYAQVKAVSTAYWLAYLRDDRAAAGWLRRDREVRGK